MHPACPNKEQNHLQNSLLRRTQFWVRKTFSKPASLKRASLVAFPVAISHKVSVDTKTLRFFNPDAKIFTKINLNTVPKLAVPFLGPHAQLSKRTKEKHFHGPIFGTVWRYQKWDRKIAKSTAKADPSEQKYNCVYLSKKHIDLEQRRPAHAKPDFNWLSGPKNGTWKRMWYQLSPFTGSNVAIAMQHDPGNIQQDKSFSSWLAAATLSP